MIFQRFAGSLDLPRRVLVKVFHHASEEAGESLGQPRGERSDHSFRSRYGAAVRRDGSLTGLLLTGQSIGFLQQSARFALSPFGQ
jgi:hypothetical protein